MKKRVVVIGGGPGGYVAAIRAAQLGAETHLVESDRLGGTCLNVGCIPTKALLHTAGLFRAVKEGARHGLAVDGARIEWPVLMNHKEQVVNRLVKGVAGLLTANKVGVHQGRAVLQDSRTVKIEGEKSTSLTADIIVLAVGSLPVRLEFPGAELPGVIDSTAALSLPKAPSSLIIVGGGVIGAEFAALFSSLGAKVAVVEMLPRILAPMDGQLTAVIEKELKKMGVKILTGARLAGVKQDGDKLSARVIIENKEETLEGEKVLVAVGRRSNTAGLGLEELGIGLEKGAVAVDDNFETSVPGVYAIGDCNGRVMLAHAASAQGTAAVEHALGHRARYNPQAIPSCLYTSPEAAAVGLTEEEAGRRGLDYRVGLFPLAGNGKSLIEGCENGLVKIIAGARHGEILGAHIVGPRATDLIGEMALAMNLEATVDELVATVHAHPTVSEALAEAALAFSGKAIHWPPGLKVK
ncbi:MAG: dihydrolipoyl dehydrogenase [Peptococcaceae bacterium]|jgi:dihydrolipoamide dehydrogenase|nr:dihydrolipoyl dehydrogenase [Peptococcaceae bacterium]MDH7524682.1 dihydrolipoyl dehydrogenase [Peptococcaceae bacterium]